MRDPKRNFPMRRKGGVINAEIPKYLFGVDDNIARTEAMDWPKDEICALRKG